MRRILFLFFLLLVPRLQAVDLITASVAFTNAAGTTNGQTIVINGNTRTFTNNVVVAATQIGTNSTPTGSKTNAYAQIALNPVSQVTLVDSGSTNFQLRGNSAVVMAVTLSATVGTVSYSTQTVSSLYTVRVPVSAESAGQQTNVSSALVAAISSTSTTNLIPATAVAVATTLVGISNAQTIIGIKNFGTAGGLNGNVGVLTNGAWLDPSLTNGFNYGNAFSSPGTAGFSEQFGSGSLAIGVGSLVFGIDAYASNILGLAIGNAAIAADLESTALGNVSFAGGERSTAVGYGSLTYSNDSIALGSGAVARNLNTAALGATSTADYENSTAIGFEAATTATDQVRLGTSSQTVSIPGKMQVAAIQGGVAFTNSLNFEANSDLAFTRYPITSLANGNNAAVPVGTNMFVEVSGPSSAFTINGIANGRDGKLIVIVNQTGQNMTIAHDSGTDPTAGNRIYTMTGADRATTANGAATLIYNGNSARWILISIEQ